MKPKLFHVIGDANEGFCIHEDFINRVINSVDDRLGINIRNDADNEHVAHAIVMASIAEFMNTFEVKKQ